MSPLGHLSTNERLRRQGLGHRPSTMSPTRIRHDVYDLETGEAVFEFATLEQINAWLAERE